ncbi:MAG: hypothetical protein JW984_12875 [Deltaproteobacteria bacterium]|uniref:Uncharacterized protein n=1 Tax=Candidatus Zymogenus saltonus TaxID=2844893 RepID=A0A9D8PRA8_9DELT|nr:hypothetical protein [Candidatus Zymogenus saltonus]
MKIDAVEKFIGFHHREIMKRVEELENFGPTDICFLKGEVERGIQVLRMKKVVPLMEMRGLYIGLIAIRVVEVERGYA